MIPRGSARRCHARIRGVWGSGARRARQMAGAGLFDPNARLKPQKGPTKTGPVDARAAAEKKKKARKEAKKQRKRNR